MREAFFVLGPEASGTKMLAAAFISAGCQGDAGHTQRFDDLKFDAAGERIVFRRSLPHGGRWPDLISIAAQMRAAGYRVSPVLSYREPFYLVQAQLRTNRLEEGKIQAPYAYSEQQARNQIETAVLAAVAFAGRMREPLTVIPYELFVESEPFRGELFKTLGLPPPVLEFYNANEKYDRELVK